MSMKHTGASTIAEADHLIALIASDDKRLRSFAWRGAGKIGAPAVKKLAAMMSHGNIEVAWAARRALREIAHHVGRPFGVSHAKEDVIAELIPLLGSDQPLEVRREVLWLLAEIGSDESVDPVARLLNDAELREDARMALDHIPGDLSLAALKAALEQVPEEFKINIAQSLRHRGVVVPGHPCQKLVPAKRKVPG